MRRFNYTNRQRIDRSNVLVSLRPREDGTQDFEVTFDLSHLGDDPLVTGASVFLEAYGGTKFERFNLGTVAAPTQNRGILTSFGTEENVLFRLKVVDTAEGSGRIIAMASRISPKAGDQKPHSSLLPVSVRPLEGLVYKIEFPDDDSYPTLVLNQDLDTSDQGIKAAAKTPLFVSLVIPEAIRQILTLYLVIEPSNDDDAGDQSPSAKWKRLARRRNPEPLPVLEHGEDRRPILDWIDTAVERIAADDLRVLPKFRQDAEKL